jgi:hypothetical protein
MQKASISALLRATAVLALLAWAGMMQVTAQVARIVARAERHSHVTSGEDAEAKRIQEMEWRIHGQVLHFGDDTLRIPVDDVLDTIYYRRDLRADWDTMICNIDRPKLISFLYNDCCGAFNVSDASMRRLVQASVEFRLVGNARSKVYLGMMGEDGALLQAGRPAVLHPVCHSAVVPNIFPISLRQIWPCSPADSCGEGACLMQPGQAEPQYEFGFKSVTTIAEFYYLPIDERPLVVTYDLRTRKVTVQ